MLHQLHARSLHDERLSLSLVSTQRGDRPASSVSGYLVTNACLDTVKARLRPELNEPFFEVVNEWSGGMTRCRHREHGFRLDTIDRRAICKGCGKDVDAFDALVAYAKSETRLLSTRQRIEDAEKRERDRKAREKARRPFGRAVNSVRAVKDLTLKTEPVIGYTLTLECGHSAECGPNRKPRMVTCRQCQADAIANT